MLDQEVEKHVEKPRKLIDFRASWGLLRAPWRRFGGVLEVLEGVLEAFGGVLEGLDGVLEAMLDQDSTKMTNKSNKSERP